MSGVALYHSRINHNTGIRSCSHTQAIIPTPYLIVCYHTHINYHLDDIYSLCLRDYIHRGLYLWTINSEMIVSQPSLWVSCDTYPNDMILPIAYAIVYY